jgi:hypothetical protein
MAQIIPYRAKFANMTTGGSAINVDPRGKEKGRIMGNGGEGKQWEGKCLFFPH